MGSWEKYLLAKGLEGGAYIAAGSYPEDGTTEELDQYYFDLLDFAQGADDYLGLSSINPRNLQDLENALNYLTGDGDPIELFDNTEDLNTYLSDIHNQYGFNQDLWTPNTNPDYPASEGWEHLQYDVTAITRSNDFWHKSNKKYPEGKYLYIHDQLGETSAVRRRYHKDDDEWEYQIVDQMDLLKGETTWEEGYNRIVDYGKHNISQTEFREYQDLGAISLESDFETFDPENNQNDFNAVVDIMSRFSGDSYLFGEDIHEKEAYVGYTRYVDPVIAEAVGNIAPDFFDVISAKGETALKFMPSQYAWRYLMEYSNPLNITGTGYIEGE
jgi:hypothetical protein